MSSEQPFFNPNAAPPARPSDVRIVAVDVSFADWAYAAIKLTFAFAIAFLLAGLVIGVPAYLIYQATR